MDIRNYYYNFDSIGVGKDDLPVSIPTEICGGDNISVMGVMLKKIFNAANPNPYPEYEIIFAGSISDEVRCKIIEFYMDESELVCENISIYNPEAIETSLKIKHIDDERYIQ